jgi:hypothetical protein
MKNASCESKKFTGGNNMSKLKNLKVNVPKVAIEDYFWVVAGVAKAGKSSLFAKVAEEYFGNTDSGLIIGFEKGYSALKVKAVDVDDWNDWEDIVDDLVENKEEYGLKLLALDTVDIMMDMAIDLVIQEWNAKNPSKRTNEIGGVGAKGNSNQGFGVGTNLAKKKVRDSIAKLQKAGYGIFAITHSKDKKVEEKNGATYDQLTLSLSASANEVFVNMADFIVFLTVEAEKSGKNLVSKRYINFRSDDYVSIAGSRFQNVPNRIEYDVQEFLEVFRNAVQSEFDSGVNLEQIKREQAEKREAAAQEYIDSYKSESGSDSATAEELIESLNTAVKALDSKQKVKVTSGFKTILGGTANYSKIDDVELLQKCLDLVGEIVG